MKKIIIFTLLLLLTTLPSTAKGIKTHMDGMRQHGGARSAIPSVMVDQESAYVTVEISRYSGEYAIYISDEYGGKSSVSCPLKPSDSAPLKHSTMPP